MRRAPSNAVCLVLVLIVSVFVSDVDNHVDTNSSADSRQTLRNQLNPPPPWTEPRKYEIGDSADHLMWYLQISDLHLSIFREPSRITDLKEFCNTTVPALSPYVVVASGDLTDSKTSDDLGSGEILSEWEHYKRVLDETEVAEKTIWLDLRGNHDNFNVLNENSITYYFGNYSIQGKLNPRSYMRQISVGSEKYTFMVIDACLHPGPRRPFNFIGLLDADEIEKIHRLVEQSRRNESDYILWVGHYPTSCIVAKCEGGVRNLMGKYNESMVYMSGHYHTIAGLVPNMYTLHDAGYLELELADWKSSRTYRLAAMDHGQFSFIDIKHREWPVILITNPKHALYAMPQRENSQSIVESTHIRILAFSLTPIKSVKVQIDDGSWEDCYHVKGPLYAIKWNPLNYTAGIHNIRARVIDNDGREKEIEQPFVLDGTKLSFGSLPRFLLMADAVTLFQIFFGTIVTIVVAPLCILRFLHVLCEKNWMKHPRLRMPVCGCFIRKLWILSTVDSLFFPLIFYALYLTFGPWAVGEVIDNETGVMFAWGMYIGSSYLPGCFSYLFGFIQLFTFNLPLILLLAYQAERRLDEIEKPLRKSPTILRLLLRHSPFFLLAAWQTSQVYIFLRAYGTLAAAFCTLRTWNLILAVFLWYRVHTMPHECLRPAARVLSASGSLKSQDIDEDQTTPL